MKNSKKIKKYTIALLFLNVQTLEKLCEMLTGKKLFYTIKKLLWFLNKGDV
jgi:hypothetical protein